MRHGFGELEDVERGSIIEPDLYVRCKHQHSHLVWRSGDEKMLRLTRGTLEHGRSTGSPLVLMHLGPLAGEQEK